VNIALTRRALAAAALAGLVAVGAPTVASAGQGTTNAVGPRVAVHFDLTAGQLPENIVLDRHGSVDVTFAASRQVARVGADGRIAILATLPAPADAAAKTPVLGFPLATGLVRDGRTFYVAYATGSTETGIWTFTEGHQPRRLAALPTDGLPNGLAQDPATGLLYVTDPVKGRIYSVSPRGEVHTVSSDPALAADGLLGVNGIKIHNGAVYVSNLDRGTILRLPTGPDRRHLGPARVVASGLTGVDDFAFTGRGDEIVAALNTVSQVVRITQGRTKVLLTAADGLSNPTSVAVRGRTLLVPSAAYNTQKDPNLLIAALRG
jgi:sugar lactone lactonase YvrE